MNVDENQVMQGLECHCEEVGQDSVEAKALSWELGVLGSSLPLNTNSLHDLGKINLPSLVPSSIKGWLLVGRVDGH